MSDVNLQAIHDRAAKATAGPWKLWGMSVMADHAGTSNVNDAIPIADTNSHPAMPPRTFNATFIANARKDIPDLIAEVLALRAERDEWRTLAGKKTETVVAVRNLAYGLESKRRTRDVANRIHAALNGERL